MDEPASCVLADGLLYPMEMWLAAFTEAVFQRVEEGFPARGGIRAAARFLRDVRTESSLHAAQRRACVILRSSGAGVAPGDMTVPFQISAVFPVDNTVPPR